MGTQELKASPRVFLLSPANCRGSRGRLIVSPRADFALARQLRSSEGAPLGELFSFVSGLYFRAKLAYARRFARPPDPVDPVTAGGVLIITPNAGLRAADIPVTFESFLAFARVDIDLKTAAYRSPLEQGAHALRSAIGPDCEVVLLGSIASGKYVDLLLPIFSRHLLFPLHFVGRGDMSRGGLMLRRVAADLELECVPLADAERRGARQPRLEPLCTKSTTAFATRTTKTASATKITKLTKSG